MCLSWTRVCTWHTWMKIWNARYLTHLIAECCLPVHTGMAVCHLAGISGITILVPYHLMTPLPLRQLVPADIYDAWNSNKIAETSQGEGTRVVVPIMVVRWQTPFVSVKRPVSCDILQNKRTASSTSATLVNPDDWLKCKDDHIDKFTGLILGLRPANERRRYKVTTSLIGWTQT